MVARLAALELVAFPSSRRPSAIVVCRNRSQRPSRGCGRPQPGDEHQDILEHLPRSRDLGQLERDVAAMAHDLSADLDQLIPQTGQRPRRDIRAPGRQLRLKLPKQSLDVIDSRTQFVR
jgi:hypothetical protein